MLRFVACFVAVAGLAVALTACGKSIGDECTISTDCSNDGDRACDRSQPGGYCTVEGCDESSCGDEAVCIRFFSAKFLTRACDPMAEDAPEGTDDCIGSELCLPEGLCAPRASERRYCAASCSDDGDCRGGYECRLSGTRGSVALTTDSNATPRFCAPR